ncbi:hypothetical protein [Cutibacterium sp.]|uniref:hypothetical protein n=1 Tax=Cutibacterium sp. TaxID=1912221 RepID=UPI0026DAE7D3|nr:hypothetical protein [Cutibacterium sp.]MDO4412761.1 hypothetical protein [Cutibacterium sp.]
MVLLGWQPGNVIFLGRCEYVLFLTEGVIARVGLMLCARRAGRSLPSDKGKDWGLVACPIAFSVSYGDAQLGAQVGTVIAALFVVAKTIVELRTV